MQYSSVPECEDGCSFGAEKQKRNSASHRRAKLDLVLRRKKWSIGQRYRVVPSEAVYGKEKQGQNTMARRLKR